MRILESNQMLSTKRPPGLPQKLTETHAVILEPALRVHVPNNWVRGNWVMVIKILILGKYMIIGYLDP